MGRNCINAANTDERGRWEEIVTLLRKFLNDAIHVKKRKEIHTQ